jgi:hypothetical protein
LDDYIQEVDKSLNPPLRPIPEEIIINPSKVEQYLQELKVAANIGGDDEWMDVLQDLEIQVLNAKNQVQVAGYRTFHINLLKVFPYPKHRNWRKVSPEIYLSKAEYLIKRVRQTEQLNLALVHAIYLYLYFASYNAVNGIRVKRKRD